MSGDHNMYQKPRSYLDDFECPRCGHCCQLLEKEQKPVAWMHTTGTGHVYFRKKPQDKVFSPQPVYTVPPKQWVGLTDEEIEKGRDQTFSVNNPYCPCDSKTMRKAVRWAEAKLKEKNT